MKKIRNDKIDGRWCSDEYIHNLLDTIDKKNKIIKEIKAYCEEIESRSIDYTDTDYDLGQDSVARDILKILRGEE